MLLDRGHESVLEHQSISVRFICDRGISHELVRHRLASFSQESTRYCNYQKDVFGNELTFIAPFWIREDRIDFVNEKGFAAGLSRVVKIEGKTTNFYSPAEQIFFAGLHHVGSAYMVLVEYGWSAQQARAILPNCLKTEIVVTANLREWRTIFKQRTSAAAHPQMRELMCPLLEELKQVVPVVFNDIKN
jgi:thymidylate synthase (FAD)